jgi:uncharacterized protein YbjT (DUF2867 family)
MYVILGATGHVGSAVANALLEQGQQVSVIMRDSGKGNPWKQRGAKVAVADVHDVAALRAVFRQGRRAFLLNPPADPSTDTNAEEQKTVRCILAALEGSGLEKVVAESTYGAQPGDRCGDLTILYALEQGLRSQPIPAAIIRAAYYMSNWDPLLEPARKSGMLPTMYPAQLKIPMVAPHDLGRTAARLLTEPADRTGVTYVEGPERYSTADVAAAFAQALGRPVDLAVTPREGWQEAYRSLGFSAAAAFSYARMTAVSIDGGSETMDDPVRGTVTLQSYVCSLRDRNENSSR